MFGAVAPGELVVYADSAGLVAIAVNGGDAARQLGLTPGRRYRSRRDTADLVRGVGGEG